MGGPPLVTIRGARHLLLAALVAALAAGEARAHDEVALDVVTLNAWGLPAPIARQRPARMERVARWLDRVDADVVALQEVWNGAVPHLPLTVVRSGRGGDDGLALRARRALHDVEVMRFSRARGFDVFKRKGALRGRIDLDDGRQVWVVSTHLQAGGGRANAAVREAQLHELLAWLAPLDAPIVLLGDVNVDASQPEDAGALALLASAGFVDVAEQLGVLDATYPANGHRYDRILVRGGPRFELEAVGCEVVVYDDDPRTEAPRFLSDHHPVRARLRLRPRAALARHDANADADLP